MDPYMESRLTEPPETDSDAETQDLSNTGTKRTARGPTLMRGIWGRRESEGLIKVSYNEFGQPDDEVATKLSNFMGTIIRDKDITPLTYSSWHEVPHDIKEKFWRVLQTKFDLHDSVKTWVMQNLGKKLRDWRAQLKKKYYRTDLSYDDQINFRDERVDKEQFEYLVKYWSSEKAQETSRKNQASRAQRFYNHTTGTKSFARVRREKAKVLTHPPTRAQMFKSCFTRKDGTQSAPVKDAIMDLENKEKESGNESNEDISRNDLFAQVMGNDKNGHVRTYGCGVCPSHIYRDKPSRTTNNYMIINTLQEKVKDLNSKLHQLESNNLCEQIHPTPAQDTSKARDDLGHILQVANRHEWSFSSTGCSELPLIGSVVCLKSIIKPTETIAIGLLYSTDPSNEVGEQELGSNYWEIYVQVPVKPNERLVRSLGQYKTIGQAVGTYIAWPKAFVIPQDIDFSLPTELQTPNL